MSSAVSFSRVPNDDAYFVHDRMSTLRASGVVYKTEWGHWSVIPHTERDGDPDRKLFQTRREAAHALTRFIDTGDRDWIYA